MTAISNIGREFTSYLATGAEYFGSDANIGPKKALLEVGSWIAESLYKREDVGNGLGLIKHGMGVFSVLNIGSELAKANGIREKAAVVLKNGVKAIKFTKKLGVLKLGAYATPVGAGLIAYDIAGSAIDAKDSAVKAWNKKGGTYKKNIKKANHIVSTALHVSLIALSVIFAVAMVPGAAVATPLFIAGALATALTVANLGLDIARLKSKKDKAANRFIEDVE